MFSIVRKDRRESRDKKFRSIDDGCYVLHMPIYQCGVNFLTKSEASEIPFSATHEKSFSRCMHDAADVQGPSHVV